MQDAILEAITRSAGQSTAALDVLKQHIGVGLSGASGTDDPYAVQVRLAEIDQALNELYAQVPQPGDQDSRESRFEALYDEEAALKEKLAAMQTSASHAGTERSRLDELFTVVDGLRNRPLSWDETLIRQMVECIRVISRDKIRMHFRSGVEVDAELGA